MKWLQLNLLLSKQVEMRVFALDNHYSFSSGTSWGPTFDINPGTFIEKMSRAGFWWSILNYWVTWSFNQNFQLDSTCHKTFRKVCFFQVKQIDYKNFSRNIFPIDHAWPREFNWTKNKIRRLSVWCGGWITTHILLLDLLGVDFN